MKKRIVLLGPPASGKGTQGDRLSSAFDIPHVSTGALLRSESSRGTSIGLEAEEWTLKGMLVPDELVVRIITNWLSINGTSFLLDGFPRTIGQAQHLDTSLALLNAPIDLVLLLDLSETEIRRRILERLSCLQCGATYSSSLHSIAMGTPCQRCGTPLIRRNDDTEKTLEQRLSSYREITLPVIDYYERTAKQIFHHIPAGGTSDEVFARLAALVTDS